MIASEPWEHSAFEPCGGSNHQNKIWWTTQWTGEKFQNAIFLWVSCILYMNSTEGCDTGICPIALLVRTEMGIVLPSSLTSFESYDTVSTQVWNSYNGSLNQWFSIRVPPTKGGPQQGALWATQKSQDRKKEKLIDKMK